MLQPYRESNGKASERTKARKAERNRVVSIIEPEIQVVNGKIKFKPYQKSK